MKWLLRLLIIIMAAGITVTAVIFVLGQTIWNANYLETQAAKTNLASGLSQELPAVAATYAPGPVTRDAVANVVTTDYVTAQLQTILPGLVEAYKTGSATPTLNLTDISSQLAQSDITLPANLETFLNDPQPVVPPTIDSPLRSTAHTTGQLIWIAPIVALLAAVLIAVAARGRRWLGLSQGLFGAALLVALAALIVQLPPRLVGATLDTSLAKPLVPAIRGFLQSIASDQTHRLIIIAVVLAAIGLLLAIAHVVIHSLGRFKKEPKFDDNRPATRPPEG